jgi:predicted enzyme related to lactoylglutathione lyase
MNPVVHFEMPAKDKKRVSEFYSSVFGWRMHQMGEEMGNYVVAHTTETDEKTSMVKNPGAINGGFYDYKDEPGFQYPSVVIAVDDLKASIEAVKKAGGTIVGLQMEIPGIGSFISIQDTEGNRVGMLQPAPRV